ncbi:SDR family NAD(P)-dependent oxidoreductase [Bernardetia sp.]|uniref:SDR family NAD(P)-dependent oxidoreductase n=1 Tax=Bernardetia sp. TaxID=1937974 RepID=UPI0025C26903|nr:SDR family NAD(P)-dependent oxidoreductase [Bernardetia sp.]
MKSISILGCGWLGLEVAKYFIKKEIQVNGSTTSKEKTAILKNEKIKPYILQLTEKNIEAYKNNSHDFFKDFFHTDIALINIPPPRENKDFYKVQMEFIKNYLLKNEKATKKIIFISSTSIYKDYPADLNKEVIEKDVETKEEAARKDIFDAENIFVEASKNKKLETVVLRAGGLMGGKRVAGKYFAGKKGLNTGSIPVNFIHRKDLVEIISIISDKLVENILFNSKKRNKFEVFNVVCPTHPTRQKVYKKNAKDYNFEAPTFQENTETPNYKVVDTNKLKDILNYEFHYPNPLYFPIESDI